ncbi:serine protease family S10, partial [Thraustotheca clavata]
FTELGPFVVNSDLSLSRNPYSWNRKANIVFLESPAGVGYSSPVLPSAQYNDDYTANRSYEFLREFFDTYPSYVNRDFYITGESYAGIYIPFLTEKLVKEPLSGVELKGFAIGNAFTDVALEMPTVFEYMRSHALISLETYEKLQTNCANGTLVACFEGNKVCSNSCGEAITDGYLSSDEFVMDSYDIYADICKLNSSQTIALPSPSLRPMHRGVIGPCQAQYTAKYLRQPSVQEALHVIKNGEQPVEWTDCSAEVGMSYHSSSSSLPKYPTILSAGLNVLIYSGDADTVVNFMGTQQWLNRGGLNLKVEDKWKGWFGPDKQLAGYTERYTNLTFTTIKGAGHMVPASRPLHALYMFECYLYGTKACQGFTYPQDEFQVLTGAAPPTALVSSSSSDLALSIGLTALVVLIVGAVGLGYYRYTRRSSYTPLTA